MKVAARIAILAAFVIVARPSADAPRLPTPEASFGFQPGADYKLATYDQSIDYFKKLAAASKYVKLVEAGKTSQGRTMYFALISTPENLAQIDRYREIARRLAHPQGLTDAEARRLAHGGQGVRPHRRRAARDRSRRRRSTRRCSPTTCCRARPSRRPRRSSTTSS